MPLPANVPLDVRRVYAHSKSVGSDAAAAYVPLPVRSRVIECGAVIYAAVDANVTVTCAIDGTTITGANLSITSTAGSAAGYTVSSFPTGANTGIKNSVLSFTPGGGQGTSVAATFYADVEQF